MKNKLIKRILAIIAGLITIFLLVYIIATTFIRSYSADGIITDGLGRTLTHTPLLLRLFLGEEFMYAGFKFFVLDNIIFWVCAFIIYQIMNFYFYKSETNKTRKL